VRITDHAADEGQERAGVTAKERFEQLTLPGCHLRHQPFILIVCGRHRRALDYLPTYMRAGMAALKGKKKRRPYPTINQASRERERPE
jgi:hypothetical protein